MLSCKDVSEHASDYIDGNMPLMKRIQMKLHLFMCVHCRNFIRQFTTSIKTVAGMKAEAPSAENIDEQVKRLLAEKHNHPH